MDGHDRTKPREVVVLLAFSGGGVEGACIGSKNATRTNLAFVLVARETRLGRPIATLFTMIGLAIID